MLVEWQVLNFYDQLGCKLKDLDTICELNHYSVDVLRGKKFTEFSCRCGWKSGKEEQWRASVEAHAQLEGDALKEADLQHSSHPVHRRHKPFNPPLFHLSTIDMSADVLHLIFINMFVFFFEMTILVFIFEMDPTTRTPFEVYVRSIGLPMKVVKATTMEEMKQGLTGRDAKVVMSQAIKHIPTLLEFAHAGSDEVRHAMNTSTGSQGSLVGNGISTDEDFTWTGDSDESSGSEDEGDMDNEPRMMRDARAWDHFRQLCFAMRTFERDDMDYREQRAVEAFNAAALTMGEYKRLHPDAMSACPHVALCVVPRQMVAHGDPGRRGTDHSESYGASIKDSIHRRCLRRRKAAEATLHHRRNPDGSVTTWTQKALSFSRVMQTFRDQAVRERLMRDEESVPYLLRKHYNLASTGFSRVGETVARSGCDAVDPCATIYSRLAEGRDLS